MKNRGLLIFLVTILSVNAFSQMHVKKHNFTTFATDKKGNTKVLDGLSSAEAKSHPEYGITPYNAQCVGCVELLDERTIDSRQFINAEKKSRTYTQTSYFPLHYKKSANDIWRTIDQRLRPVVNQPNVYVAANQPAPTKCDLNRKSSSVTSDGFEFEYNRNLSMYFFDDNTAYTQRENANYTTYTIGEEGLNVKNIFAGIDMEQIFAVGQIKTNFVITAPLQLPISKGWMVIEDHFSLPAGYNFEEAPGGEHLEGGKYFRGDYIITNPKGEKLFKYEKPVYVDARAYGMHGMYKLINNGGDYTLQILIPVDWLNSKTNTYPLVIDPILFAFGQNGAFTSSGNPSASLGFTSMALGACPYHVTVFQIPGKSELTDTYVDVEYSLTYDNTCGNPPLQAPFCTFSQVTMEIQCDTCQTTTGQLKCDPANPPYTGTCTTDSALVPGANAIWVTGFVPNYLGCLPPQCPNYDLDFTLLNRDSICGDSCGYLCARGNFWRVTIGACQVEGTMSANNTQVCAGQPVTFTAHPNCGVPPYHYLWTAGGVDTIIYNTPNFVLYPEASVTVSCIIYDTCGGFAITDPPIDVTVIPAPPADAGTDARLCEGGTVQLGGSPTTTPGSTVLWSGENATVTGWLNSTNSLNPVATVPAGKVDTVYYVLRVSNSNCFRTDTVSISSVANPTPVIDTSGATTVCANQNVTIGVTGTYASYLWNNGSTTQSISVSQPGQYFATVTDANGCSAITNTITVANIAVPTVNVFPDTLIVYGDSVMLSTDLNLNSAIVDSFIWSPATSISCTGCTNPIATPLNDTYYSVIVHAAGCTVSDSALIRVILPNNFYIPNAFTPNGDGNNDNFYIQAQSGVRVLTFQVFNRIGEKIHDGSYPWDGTYKGKQAPAGVYIYIFKLGLFGDDYALFRKGSVTMIR